MADMEVARATVNDFISNTRDQAELHVLVVHALMLAYDQAEVARQRYVHEVQSIRVQCATKIASLYRSQTDGMLSDFREFDLLEPPF